MKYIKFNSLSYITYFNQRLVIVRKKIKNKKIKGEARKKSGEQVSDQKGKDNKRREKRKMVSGVRNWVKEGDKKEEEYIKRMGK